MIYLYNEVYLFKIEKRLLVIELFFLKIGIENIIKNFGSGESVCVLVRDN